ncbi:hypothetical protein ACJX0J_025035, partial [Zea mays]
DAVEASDKLVSLSADLPQHHYVFILGWFAGAPMGILFAQVIFVCLICDLAHTCSFLLPHFILFLWLFLWTKARPNKEKFTSQQLIVLFVMLPKFCEIKFHWIGDLPGLLNCGFMRILKFNLDKPLLGHVSTIHLIYIVKKIYVKKIYVEKENLEIQCHILNDTLGWIVQAKGRSCFLLFLYG